MKKFKVYNIIEYRSDIPLWAMFRVNHTDGKDYLMAYDKDGLREVYFVGEGIPNYFMSCRARDLTQISHYYVDRMHNEVRRYENGKHNRTIYDERNGIMWCRSHIYKQVAYDSSTVNAKSLHKDLEEFLNRFYASGLHIERPPYVL